MAPMLVKVLLVATCLVVPTLVSALENVGPKPGLIVGTHIGTDNIAHDGAVASPWQPSNHFATSTATQKTASYYIQMGKGMGSQAFSKPTVSMSDESVMHPELSDAASEGGTLTEEAKHLLITYHCQKSGETTVTVTFNIDGFSPVSFAWTKICLDQATKASASDAVDDHHGVPTPEDGHTPPPPAPAHAPEPAPPAPQPAPQPTPVHPPAEEIAKTNGFSQASNQPKVGFMVGREPNQPDVVVDGSATDAWLPGKHEIIAGKSDSQANFHIWMKEGMQDYSSPHISVLPLEIAAPKTFGAAAAGGTASSNPLTLSVNYNCLKVGPAVFNVYTELKGYRYVTWSWAKFCSEADVKKTMENGIGDSKTGADDGTVVTGGKDGLPVGIQRKKNETADPNETCISQPKPDLPGGPSDGTKPIPLEKQNPRVGLNIGTKAGSDDWVADGVANAAKPTAFMIDNTVNSMTMWLTMTKGAGKQKFATPKIEVDPPNVAKPAFTEAGGGVATEEGTKMPFQFFCLQGGTAKVTITIPVSGHKAVQFTLNKKCDCPGSIKPGKGFIPGTSGIKTKGALEVNPRYGLTITTAWDDHVVVNGQATEPFQVARPTFVDDTSSKDIKFIVGMAKGTGEQSFGPPKLTAMPKIGNPQLVGTTIQGGKVSGDDTAVITVDYNCNEQKGQTVLTLYMTVPESAPISLSWTKICGGTASPNMAKADSVASQILLPPLKGMDIGTTPDDEDVCHNGKITPEYNQTHPLEIVDVDVDVSTFYVKVCKAAGHVQSGVPKVYANPANIMKPKLAGELKYARVLRDGDPMKLMVEHNCFAMKGGSAIVTVEFNVDKYRPAIFSYTKNCPPGGSRKSKISSKSTNGTAGINVPRPGVNIGISDSRSSEVVSDGVPLDAWMPEEHETSLKPSVDQTTFYVHLDKKDGSLPIQTPQISASPSIVTATVSGDIVGATSLTEIPLELVVNYVCQQAGTSVLTIDFPVSEGLIRFAWEKQCSNGVGGRFSWLPFSGWMLILFMSVLLILTLCICGCVFKYCVYHLRGVRTIPFWDNCCGAVHFQMAPANKV